MNIYINDITESASNLLATHGILTGTSVKEGLARLNDLSGDTMTLFVLDKQGSIIGTVTDGDVRRALISGIRLDEGIEAVMNRKFLFADSEDHLPMKMEEGRRRHIELLPLIVNGILKDIIDLRTTKSFIPVEAVLMAGGRGERLRPLTDSVPKPLLHVGDKAIIDYNVEDLESCGIKKIYVTVNYLADQIESHFSESGHRAEIECVREPKRLGTLGSVSLIENITSKDIILMNSDLLTSVDFHSMYVQHHNSGSDITVGAVPYSVSIPFAIMNMKNDRVLELEEKPTYNYFANAGVYIIRSELLKKMVKDEYLDAPDFVSSVIKDGGNVGCYHIEGTWIDIGSPDDYRMACELMSRRLKL